MRKKKQQDIESAAMEHLAPDVTVADGGSKKKNKHIFAKLMCLLSATVVWLYVMNLESTDFERVFTQVPVVVDGVAQLSAESDMSVISGYSNTVDVIVSGKKSEVQALSAEDIRVSVDVSALQEAGKFTVPVQIQLPDNFTAVNESLLSAEIYVDVDTTREIPVRIINLDYIVSSSYTMGEPVLSHETVTVTGPQQVLELIDCAALEFDLGNVTTSTTMVGTPHLVDEDGMRISNPYVRFETTEITVGIPVETTRAVKLTCSYTVPDLVNLWMVEFAPATVTVVGDPMLLASLEEISVYELSTDVKAGEYVIGGVMELPEGVSLKEPLDSITVRIHRIVG